MKASKTQAIIWSGIITAVIAYRCYASTDPTKAPEESQPPPEEVVCVCFEDSCICEDGQKLELPERIKPGLPPGHPEVKEDA